MEAFVTLGEAAELEGIGYDTMQKKVRRTPEKFNVTMEQRESGGREQVMVAVSSLSRKARAAWEEKERLELSGTQGSGDGGKPPWYVGEDIDWFIEKHREEWYRAMELGNTVREFLEYDEKGRTEYAETFAQERLGKGKRTQIGSVV